MTATLDALEATVGPGRLGLVHANDSLDACGSKRDRHTTIGEGSIGVAPFAELLAHPSMAGVPVVVETPSLRDGDPCGGHAADIKLLNSLIPEPTAP
jgi:deoxyribonuclease-4